MLHFETVAPETLELLKRLQAHPFLAGTRLVGGTALALQLGHRISVDLDLFGVWSPPHSLGEALTECGEVERDGGQGNLQFFHIDGVKVDCVAYPYPWIDAPVEEDGLRLASPKDIAAMKINAVTNRGTRKDFVDLAFLLERFPLEMMLEWFLSKYADVASPAMAVRSLVYFKDAEAEPMPRMLHPFDWEEAKSSIRAAVRAFA